jgi:hypothetical protein
MGATISVVEAIENYTGPSACKAHRAVTAAMSVGFEPPICFSRCARCTNYGLTTICLSVTTATKLCVESQGPEFFSLMTAHICHNETLRRTVTHMQMTMGHLAA